MLAMIYISVLGVLDQSKPYQKGRINVCGYDTFEGTLVDAHVRVPLPISLPHAAFSRRTARARAASARVVPPRVETQHAPRQSRARQTRETENGGGYTNEGENACATCKGVAALAFPLREDDGEERRPGGLCKRRGKLAPF